MQKIKKDDRQGITRGPLGPKNLDLTLLDLYLRLGLRIWTRAGQLNKIF